MSHNITQHIADIRQDYLQAALNEEVAGSDPIAFFRHWFRDALNADITEVNAMTLATVDASGAPHARTVLLKGIEDNGFTYFTNYNSNKGNEIATNNKVALLFFWKELERQVRIEGIAAPLSYEANDTYFNSRPEGSKLGAWSSPQSQIVPDRNFLDERYQAYVREFEGKVIHRPAHWGGYLVKPTAIEFWQGRSSRMHDRIKFTQQADGSWNRCRLAP